MVVTVQGGDRTWWPKCYGPFKAASIPIRVKGTIGSSQPGAKYSAVLTQPTGTATKILEDVWKGIGIIPVDHKDLTEGIHIRTEASDVPPRRKRVGATHSKTN